MLWEAHWLVVQYNATLYNKYKKYGTMHNTDTVAYATRSGSYVIERKRKYTKHCYTTITVVHNIHSDAQHIHDTETFRLPVASIMISVLAL